MNLLDDEYVSPHRHYRVPAPRGVRIANFVADGLATAVLTYGVLLLVSVAFPEARFFTKGSLTLPFLYLFTCGAYYFVGEFWSGKTLGKVLTRSMVVSVNGDAPQAKQIALRTLIRIIPLYPLFFVLGKRWHDTWARVEVKAMHNDD